MRYKLYLFKNKPEFYIFQDGNTGSHEKASQGVGIEKAVFTISRHNNFIFHYREETCKRQNTAQPDQWSGLLMENSVTPDKESTVPGIAGDRAFEVLYSNTLLAKDRKNVPKVFSISQAVPTYICWS